MKCSALFWDPFQWCRKQVDLLFWHHIEKETNKFTGTTSEAKRTEMCRLKSHTPKCMPGNIEAVMHGGKCRPFKCNHDEAKSFPRETGKIMIMDFFV